MEQKETAKYFKQIRLLLPIYRKQEKKFIGDLKAIVNEYINENPECSYDDITERFETPTEVVHNYISAMDENGLYNALSSRKLLKKFIAFAVAIILIAFAMWCGVLYKAHIDSKNSVITQEYTVIGGEE